MELIEQFAAPGASSSASSLYCSTVEDLQTSERVTSDSTYASALEEPLSGTSSHLWTSVVSVDHETENPDDSVDFETENLDDYNFVCKFPGRQIPEIKRKHIKLLEKIGEGGQGYIHIAEMYQRSLISGEDGLVNESFVAKVYKGRKSGQWPEEVFGIDVFDVHICKFSGYCIDNNSLILLMSKYDCSLRDSLDMQMKNLKMTFPRRPLHDVCAMILIIEIALGMRFLHENGILHRDLKADNIFVLLNPDGSPFTSRIGDFDVASNVVGTRLWRAPEVLQALQDGKRPVFTPQADVYSYAMTCYEILTGDIPFSEVKGYSDYDKPLSGQRPKLPSNLNPKMKDLMNRCWHQDPGMRPTFDGIVEELRGLHRELIRGSEDASMCIDEIFNNSRSWIGADPEACLVEVKELLQSCLVKYNHAEFLVLGCELVADMEQYHSQYGFNNTPIIPYTEWFPGFVFADSIIWRFGVFAKTLPLFSEGTKILRLMMRIVNIAIKIPETYDDFILTDEEMEAKEAEVRAWTAACKERILPDNPHIACQEQLKKGSRGDGSQVCDFCKIAHGAREKTVVSSLSVDNESPVTMLPPSLLSSLQEMSRARF